MHMSECSLREWAPCGEPVLLYDARLFGEAVVLRAADGATVPVLQHHQLPVRVSRVEVPDSEQARGVPPWVLEYAWSSHVRGRDWEDATLRVRATGVGAGPEFHRKLLARVAWAVALGLTLPDVLGWCPDGVWLYAQSRTCVRRQWLWVVTYSAPWAPPATAYVHASGRVQVRLLEDGSGAMGVAERPDGGIEYVFLPRGRRFWREADRLAERVIQQWGETAA